MTSKPVLIDGYCGAGGATKGYQRAGFYVIGVDVKAQPNYCGDEFVQADFLTFPLEGAQAVHASPPCQAFTSARVIHGREHPDLLTPTRERLKAWGGPWVIENVPGAPMRKDVVLCGSMFNLRVIRHRWFELSHARFELMPSCTHRSDIVSVFGHGGHIYHGVKDWREAMGIDWMTRDELAQAIPPAYTEWIGDRLLEVVRQGVR